MGIEDYPLPEPYPPENKNNIKAFVLGTDPTYFSKDKKLKMISVVFDLGKDKRYFNAINQNLKEIGLSLENVYVENLVRNYMDKETYSNPFWELFAEIWLTYIKQELYRLDPVLLTSHKLLTFLSHTPLDVGYPSEYYSLKRKIPILPNDNKLGRNLIPFYRHLDYSLKKKDSYREKVKELFKKL
jgi:hypothetical protein